MSAGDRARAALLAVNGCPPDEPLQRIEGESERELVRAFLVGYGQAVADYQAYMRGQRPPGLRARLAGLLRLRQRC